LPGTIGNEVRKLYSSGSRAIEERRYDRGLADFTKAASLAPDFALTQWKLGIFYEALGNVQQARDYFTRYQKLTPNPDDQHPVDLHLTTLDARRAKYDEEVGAAREVLTDLLDRGLNLNFAQPGGRGHRPERAHAAGKNDNKKTKKQVGGFAVPYAYAQEQLGLAADHLQLALSFSPLGAEANEMMALVYLQANDGRSAIRCFDAVAGQNLPVAFYAECRGHKLDHAARCELTPNGVRLIFLSSYNKKGQPTPPDHPAGKDGLGNLGIVPASQSQDPVDGLTLAQADIQQVETKNGVVRVKLTQQEITLSPIFLASATPVQGPPARRFANTYTRLFIRYPGLETSKLGKEGLTGTEKVKLGAAIAEASLDIAASAFMPMAAFAAVEGVQDAVTVARKLNGAMGFLKINYVGWEKIVSEQQRMLVGDPFKAIPTEPPDLTFVAEAK
jgi:Flp pilus assembly protein TadD